MAQIKVEHVTFTYPLQTDATLQDVSFTVEAGEFITVVGASGCGKSTLLRQLKREIQPHGQQQGAIYYEGQLLENLSPVKAAAHIGYVMQSPENQIVTDKVWHELAFGLENLGVEPAIIRRRVAEMANFFGIHRWFREKTTVLSGGQKQLLNLASILVMQPKVLLLDEPTSQLDPIAALEFIQTLKRLNEELGLTIICIEHRLEEVLPISDRVLVLEKGRLIYDGAPRQLVHALPDNARVMTALPTATRLFAASQGQGEAPLTIREGQRWLSRQTLQPIQLQDVAQTTKPILLEAKHVAFRYERHSPDILQHFSLTVHEQEWLTILGGNGTGKSTALNVLAGLQKPYKGDIYIAGKKIKHYKQGALYKQCLAYLPQNPKTLFTEKVAIDELKDADIEESYRTQLIEQLQLAEVLNRHPYDLSGGEQQRLALAKVLLRQPKLLLLDEPTKGLDAQAKEEIGAMLNQLRAQGLTILMVTHDIEFSAQYSTRCALFFDGAIASEGTPRAFYSGNTFYTTAAQRIARHYAAEVITCEDVIQLCKKNHYALSSM